MYHEVNAFWLDTLIDFICCCTVSFDDFLFLAEFSLAFLHQSGNLINNIFADQINKIILEFNNFAFWSHYLKVFNSNYHIWFIEMIDMLFFYLESYIVKIRNVLGCFDHYCLILYFFWTHNHWNFFQSMHLFCRVLNHNYLYSFAPLALGS